MIRNHGDEHEGCDNSGVAHMVVLNKSVLELTVLSLLAATCCVAASSLQVENFPVLFATLSLLAATDALWRCLTTSR
jgi:hypothetical protein